MLSILCVRLTIKVKEGIPESFKVGWYPPSPPTEKLGRVTLKYHRIPPQFMHKTSSSLMFPPQVNEIPSQKRRLTGATYTTPYFAMFKLQCCNV